MRKIPFLLLGLFLLQACTKTDTPSGMPAFSNYSNLPLTSIRPGGWIKTFLENQRTGLTGHIEKAGFPFNTGMWTERINENKEGIFWWPYEQTGYYIDGCIKTGYLLNDSFLINKARHQINYTLDHVQENGRLGPESLMGRWPRWPFAGFFRSFITEFEITHDQELTKAMLKHFSTFTPADFQDELDLCNAEEICWLFDITGDSSLLKMAEKSYELFKSDYNNRNRDGRNIVFASDSIPDYHGVVYLEIVKIPAILYSYTGKKQYLQEAIHGLEMMERYHMLASGVPGSTEHFNGNDERAGHESCNLATLPYTYGKMLQVTGDPLWADKIEKAVFNAGIGSVSKDFTTHQYFSSPNQMIVTLNSNRFGYHHAREAFLPGHDTECCTGNINRFMPYYCMNMWLKTKNNGVAAALFGPSEVTTHLGTKNLPVTIIQQTKYPFDEAIEFTVRTERKVTFDFQIRIPSWCNDAQITLNGKTITGEFKPGTFYSVHRKFSDGDKIVLTVPMRVTTKEWPNNGISVERGPIVFSLPVSDSVVMKKYAEDVSKKPYAKPVTEFEVKEFYPKDPWNYALDEDKLESIEVIRNKQNNYAWNDKVAPVTLKVRARKVTNWNLLSPAGSKASTDFLQTPAFPQIPKISEQEEVIELVPYGSTVLRVTVFPGTR